VEVVPTATPLPIRSSAIPYAALPRIIHRTSAAWVGHVVVPARDYVDMSVRHGQRPHHPHLTVPRFADRCFELARQGSSGAGNPRFGRATAPNQASGFAGLAAAVSPARAIRAARQWCRAGARAVGWRGSRPGVRIPRSARPRGACAAASRRASGFACSLNLTQRQTLFKTKNPRERCPGRFGPNGSVRRQPRMDCSAAHRRSRRVARLILIGGE